MSAVSGGTLWFFCNHLYSVYRLKISGFLMVPALCTLLFAVLFLTVWAGSVLLTGKISCIQVRAPCSNILPSVLWASSV